MGGKKNKNYPDGWFDYDPVKNEIPGVRLIPFKCPLPYRRFITEDMQQHKWTPEDVMLRIPNIALVIDLTYKFPAYYEPNEFLDANIAYEKIGVVGHHVPSDECYYTFCDVVKNFVMRNSRNDLVIGVHCTHGVNRTGYMICRYMVEKLRYKPGDALEEFASSRGYPVERENYRQAIYDAYKA
ncbi:RNA/RNP complex-1-interacting phosphatase-like [Uloborus diversus]|uniref:RNA/RNP complex-1-interacting phosphatase-like n=1 Tax=Uloborus diversus TaxID=327109 RepID=UPI00240A4CEE|nr:RNA/RNP complex-1-interacting phosphatase-like [Uloborus diversus]